MLLDRSEVAACRTLDEANFLFLDELQEVIKRRHRTLNDGQTTFFFASAWQYRLTGRQRSLRLFTR
jgi:hypothetical protein